MTTAFSFRRLLTLNLIWVVTCSAYFVPSVDAQQSNLLKLLAIRPRQSGFDYDRPSRAETEQCKIRRPDASVGKDGFVVVDGNGRILRQFLDNNSDDRLDQWSYYKDGIEVYRDLDTNFDKKADQYRWMGTAGIRWGLDRDQNGTIDAWRMISAEEVASEVFEAIKTGDMNRFRRVLISPEELKRKITAIFKHQSQKDKALFPGPDEREFWQRAEQRNRGTAETLDRLGFAEYEAVEAFVQWDGRPLD